VKQEPEMKCPTCGKRIPSGARLCKHCGERTPRRKKGAQSQPLFPSWLPPNRLLMAGAISLLVIIALLLVTIPTKEKRRQAKWLDEGIRIERGREGREIALNAVLGRVMAVQIRPSRRGAIAIRSLQTGKEFTFFVGWRTSYHPRRYPTVGEVVKVYYLFDKGLLEATQVKIGQ
jgi:hypothetical protein